MDYLKKEEIANKLIESEFAQRIYWTVENSDYKNIDKRAIFVEMIGAILKEMEK